MEIFDIFVKVIRTNKVQETYMKFAELTSKIRKILIYKFGSNLFFSGKMLVQDSGLECSSATER